jgi:hypothetical protein
MTEVIVNIRDDGTIVCLDHEETKCFKSLGKTKTQRASHVEPNNPVLRVVFHFMRRLFGDKGWMATFTRCWPCDWRVNLSPTDGPILPRVWRERRLAIKAEVDYLDEHLV